uniref:Uncharacterized protein n=1 Tax=Leersia perrieri TaxID=77586 RepID=A0A0D9WZ03_9ORYZ
MFRPRNAASQIRVVVAQSVNRTQISQVAANFPTAKLVPLCSSHDLTHRFLPHHPGRPSSWQCNAAGSISYGPRRRPPGKFLTGELVPAGATAATAAAERSVIRVRLTTSAALPNAGLREPGPAQPRHRIVISDHL